MKWLAAAVLALGAVALVWVGWGQPSRPHLSPRADRRPSDLPHGLSPESLVPLKAWLEHNQAGSQTRPPERDIFRKARGRPMASEAPPYEPLAFPAKGAPVPAPRLEGFVFRDPGNGASRTLAAVRFGGRVWLVGQGEIVGPYRVQRIVVENEEVFLVDTEDGQESRLSIQ